MITYIIIYIISLICLIVIFIRVRKEKKSRQQIDYALLAIGSIPLMNTLFVIIFFTLGLFWEYKEAKKQKIQENKIYRILHTRK